MTTPIRPRVRPDIAVVELDGEAVVYDQESQRLHHLNPTATLVFSLFDGSATIKQLASEVSHAYAMSMGEVEPQIRALHRQFRKAKLLEGPAGPGNG